jgi:hypothetical protein
MFFLNFFRGHKLNESILFAKLYMFQFQLKF